MNLEVLVVAHEVHNLALAARVIVRLLLVDRPIVELPLDMLDHLKVKVVRVADGHCGERQRLLYDLHDDLDISIKAINLCCEFGHEKTFCRY